jgi:hypothetical protein
MGSIFFSFLRELVIWVNGFVHTMYHTYSKRFVPDQTDENPLGFVLGGVTEAVGLDSSSQKPLNLSDVLLSTFTTLNQKRAQNCPLHISYNN